MKNAHKYYFQILYKIYIFQNMFYLNCNQIKAVNPNNYEYEIICR